MRGDRKWSLPSLAAVLALVVGIIGCTIGVIVDPPGFFRAWLCAYLFWLGVPLAGITLVLVHDLVGGDWIEAVRPVLNAAIATIPLATLAGIPAFIGLSSLYSWSHASYYLSNASYLNPTSFFIRYAIYLILWNLLGAFALWAHRVPGVSLNFAWMSGIGLVLLAFSSGFASIDWILSLEPKFWSSAFPYGAAASWFNTGFALVLLTFALGPHAESENMATLVKILLATTIFWAYIEFIQFLIIWEENLRFEIPWYLKRTTSIWQPALDVSVLLGFVIPFFTFLWGPPKRNRLIVAIVCALILISRLADKWWLVLPEFNPAGPFWLDVAAICALGGAILLIFILVLQHPHWLARRRSSAETAAHA
jgi:hypothetical protein